MKYLYILSLFFWSCSDLIKEEEQPQTQNGEIDYCQKFGWYGDGRCDTNCKKPDPDCGTSLPACLSTPTTFSPEDENCDPNSFRCPDGGQYYEDECSRCGCVGGTTTCRENPDAIYVGRGEECQLIDYSCPSGSDYYVDACGCGCLSVACNENPDVVYLAKGEKCDPGLIACDGGAEYYEDECGCGCLTKAICDYSDPDLIWYDVDPQVCAQENIRPPCPDGTRYFENECGCGCGFDFCVSDKDCPGGFCETQIEQPTCQFPTCGDQEIFCDALPQPCPVGQIREAKNGCWGECVSARTCRFVCESDDQCVVAGLGRICVTPDCPAIEGAICFNFCN